MFISKIEIANWWGKKSVSLDFGHNVTFITGPNGSGKSSICNVIHDTLNFQSKKASTSKFRFWSSIAHMREGHKNFSVEAYLLPNFPTDEFDKKINNIFLDSRRRRPNCTPRIIDNFNLLKRIESLFEQEEAFIPKYISYNYDGEKSKQNSESVLRTVRNIKDCKRIGKNINDSISSSFLYQEDRANLHNLKAKMKHDESWNYYKSSIDDRFLHVREKLADWQSNQRDKVISLISRSDSSLGFLSMESYNHPSLNESDLDLDLDLAKNRLHELSRTIELLNKYFSVLNKRIIFEKDNPHDIEKKLNILDEDSQSIIPWEVLSRGEKTLIYLFLVVFLYQENVSIFILDEPEIALHVKWQKDLIRDLTSIAPNHQFIIATHSPSLVKNGWLAHCVEVSK